MNKIMIRDFTKMKRIGINIFPFFFYINFLVIEIELKICGLLRLRKRLFGIKKLSIEPVVDLSDCQW